MRRPQFLTDNILEETVAVNPITDTLAADEQKLLTPAASKISEEQALSLMVWMRGHGTGKPPVNLTLEDVQSLNVAFDQMMQRTKTTIERGGKDIGDIKCCCCTPCCCTAAAETAPSRVRKVIA